MQVIFLKRFKVIKRAFCSFPKKSYDSFVWNLTAQKADSKKGREGAIISILATLIS